MQDKITGFRGIATSKHIYLTGCSQYGLQPPMNTDGKVPDKVYFDEGRLEVVGEGFKKEDVAAAENGCDDRERP